jgi:hypothetical protein
VRTDRSARRQREREFKFGDRFPKVVEGIIRQGEPEEPAQIRAGRIDRTAQALFESVSDLSGKTKLLKAGGQLLIKGLWLPAKGVRQSRQ